MARRIPADRFERLIRGAAEVFIARGYRLTQMSDIAESIGVAKGTLYGSVESKDALFLLCLRHADDVGQIEIPEALPVPAPPVGSIGTIVKAVLAEETRLPRLRRAIDESAPSDAAAELGEVVAELFDLMFANRHRIKLLDRCMDHPELTGLWQVAGREESRARLLQYVEARTRTGHFRPQANARLAARLILETCATWAVHIHWDRAPEPFTEEEKRAYVIDLLVRGLMA